MCASPQKENGYIPIANEIVENLARINLSPYESRLLWIIFRKTYGWNKKMDTISISQFTKLTNIQSSHICRALKKLVKKGIITQIGNGYNTTYSFQKNYELWKSLPKQVILPKQAQPLPKQALPKQADTKDTIIKDTNTIYNNKEFGFLKDPYFLSTFKDYLDMRRKIRKPATDRAKELVLKKLHEYDIKIAVKILEQSILNSWQDVYPLKAQTELQKLKGGIGDVIERFNSEKARQV